MATGYFAGLLAFVYRETRDGRRATSRRLTPFLPARWLLVPDEMQARFERRFKQGHVASMLAIPVAMRMVAADGPLWHLFVAAFLVSLVAFPLAQWWATAGLPVLDGGRDALVPVRRAEMEERQARALGPRTLAAFVVIAIVLTIPQAIVAIQDGVWWSWVGLVLFAGMGIHFARQLARNRVAE